MCSYGKYFMWYRQDVTLPFELHFLMPEMDRGKRGYSDGYADRLAQ